MTRFLGTAELLRDCVPLCISITYISAPEPKNSCNTRGERTRFYERQVQKPSLSFYPVPPSPSGLLAFIALVSPSLTLLL